MWTRALTVLLLAGELAQVEAACNCPIDHPTCEADHKCWKRGSSGYSYVGVACGKCKSNYVDPSKALKNAKLVDGKCRADKGSGGSCNTQGKEGKFAISGCDKFNGAGIDMCCPGDWNCKPPSAAELARAAACKPSKLGKFVADFVKGKIDTKVYSAKQKSAQCWDLAYAAVEHAKTAGLIDEIYQNKMNWKPDGTVWSSKTVPMKDCRPGDIAQFKGWKEPMMTAWNPHTAVVTGCFEDGAMPVHQQNPSPVMKGAYHPAEKTSGEVLIYRLDEKKKLRLYSQMPEVFQLHAEKFSLLAGVCAITGLMAAAALIVKRQRQRTFAQSEASTELDSHLYAETLNPEA